MAEKQTSFRTGCWRCKTARDLIDNLPLELRCDHRLDRKPAGMIMAKIMWSQEACEYLHERCSTMGSNSDRDTVLIDVGRKDYIHPHLFYEQTEDRNEMGTT